MVLYPLIQQLDDCRLGPTMYGHHIPAVAYVDDILIMPSNARDLQTMLHIVSSFSVLWRIYFVHVNQSLTKSHSFIFGSEFLSRTPQWQLCGQILKHRQETTHLGVELRSQLHGADQVTARIQRSRGAFFGLTPAGMFNQHLSAVDKAFLWRMIVAPVLIYGCEVCFLSSGDIARLEGWQASAVKSALRLPRTAHHSALMAALRIPSVQALVRRSIFRATQNAFRGQHRLRCVLVSSLAQLATNARFAETSASIVCHLMSLCGGNFMRVLEAASGHIHGDWVHTPRPENGLADSLSWLMDSNSAESWQLVRLLVTIHPN